MHFSSGSPTAVSNGLIRTLEGCATVSDPAGSLLFYTDGRTVYNRNHVLMANGSGLLGHSSATSSAVVVTKPGSTTHYYIFTVPIGGNANGFRYSEVDMTQSGGLGAVVSSSKNTLLRTPVSENLTAVSHANGVDVWVIVVGHNTNTYYSFLVTPTGVSTTPVTTTIGPNTVIWGYLRTSASGKKIAIANAGTPSTSQVVIFDFDNSTGTLSNPITISTRTGRPYGIEFSPDERYMYYTKWYRPSSLHQVNLKAGTSAQIIASDTIIHQPTGVNNYGALQLASDGKIYMANSGHAFLGVINNPNARGTACNFVLQGFQLSPGKVSQIGLPTFNQSFLFPSGLLVSDGCKNDYIPVGYGDTSSLDSVIYNYGDPASGSFNISRNKLDSHKFSSTGKYVVTAYIYRTHGTKVLLDTLVDTVNIYQKPVVELGNDTTVCAFDSVLLQTASSYNWYQWNTDKNTRSIMASKQGQYWVRAGEPACYGTDTINVNWIEVQQPNLGNDTTVCGLDSFELRLDKTYDAYYWNNGLNTPSIHVRSDGRYSVAVDSIGCRVSDTIDVKMINPTGFSLGEDQFLCKGKTIELKSLVNYGILNWSTGQNSESIMVSEEGEYSANFSQEGCNFNDQITITALDSPKVVLISDSVFCKHSELELRPEVTNHDKLIWNDGSTETNKWINQPGSYQVSASNFCGTSSKSVTLDWKDCECIMTIPNVFTPNGDGYNETFYPTFNCPFISYNMKIYNRWGRLLFESSDDKVHWDGTRKGEAVAQGVYIFILNYQFDSDEAVEETGHVTLIR